MRTHEVCRAIVFGLPDLCVFSELGFDAQTITFMRLCAASFLRASSPVLYTPRGNGADIFANELQFCIRTDYCAHPYRLLEDSHLGKRFHIIFLRRGRLFEFNRIERPVSLG